MGVLLLGVWLGGLLGFGVGLLLIRLIQRLGYSRQCANWLGIIAMTVSMAMFVPSLTYALLWLSTTERIGVNPPEADQLLSHWGVPAGAASDVSYYRDARLFQIADFLISEADFLAWMKSKGWQPQRYTFADEYGSTQWAFNGRPETARCEVYPVRQRLSDTPTYVLDGYCYHERFSERAESTLTITYDVQEGRAYVLSP